MNQNQKVPNTQVRWRRPVRPAGRGEKRFMLQPRNIDVRHNGRVVRRMVVRRRIIYPTTRRRREY